MNTFIFLEDQSTPDTEDVKNSRQLLLSQQAQLYQRACGYSSNVVYGNLD